MSQHTQGPWMACVADAGHLVVGPDGYAVCALPAIVRTPDEQSANAELIAMAPNLLVRLAHLVDVMPRADAEFGSGEIVYMLTITAPPSKKPRPCSTCSPSPASFQEKPHEHPARHIPHPRRLARPRVGARRHAQVVRRTGRQHPHLCALAVGLQPSHPRC